MSELDKLREEAKALMKESPDNLAMRSCWNCNGAHEHLKKAEYVIVCAMGCGHYYYKGQDITEGQVMHTSNTDHDETLKEQILTEFKQVHKLAPADYTENCTNVVMSIIKKDRERAVKNAYNNARYTLHSILSNDVDSELDHSDIEAKFMAQLSNPTQENTTVYNIAGVLIDEDRFDKLSVMQLESLADYHYKSLTKLQDMLKNPIQEMESDENSN